MIHENRGLRAHSGRPAAAGGRRLHLARHRPALRGGRHRRPAVGRRRHGRVRRRVGRAIGRRPTGRARRARATCARRRAGGDRLLLRRRDDVAAAGRRQTTAVRGRSLLRPDTGRRRLQRVAERAVLGVYAELDAGSTLLWRPPARPSKRPVPTRSGSTQVSTTPSSTTPAGVTTPTRQPRRIRRCSTGSGNISPRRAVSEAVAPDSGWSLRGYLSEETATVPKGQP